MVTKLWPAGVSGRIYTHSEPQLDRIMSGISLYPFMVSENMARFWENNNEIGDRIEVKTFFFRDRYDFGRKIVKSEIESK